MPDNSPASPPATPRPARASAKTLALLGVVAAGVILLDQVAKYLIVTQLSLNEQRDLLGSIVTLHYVENSGAAFSLGAGSTWIFAIIATLVAVFIVVFSHRIRSLAWATVFGLLLGGTVGNLADRLLRPPGFGVGHVVDFVQVAGFPAIFNIADSAIVTSMGLFLILSLRGVALDGTRTIRTAKQRPMDDRAAAQDAERESTTGA